MPDTSDFLEVNPENLKVVINLPEKYINTNTMVEIETSGIKKSLTHYANNLTVHLIENYGQLIVKNKTNETPLTTVYVKVYARYNDGSVSFYKDGYTDLSGRFDYASLNTDELIRVTKFSIMILSDQYGANVREAEPPKR